MRHNEPQEMPQWIADAIHKAEFTFVDGDTGLLIVWHGAGIFNVYNVWNGEPVDCFTTDPVVRVPGVVVRDAALGELREDAMLWARKECEEYILRVTEEGRR